MYILTNADNLTLILILTQTLILGKKEIQEIKFLQRQIEIFFVQYIAIDMIQCQYVPSQQICNNVRVCDVVIFNKKDIVGLYPHFGHRTPETLGISYMSSVMLIC